MIRKIKLGGVTQRVFALVLGIAMLVYAVYHIVSLFGEDISTIATGVSTRTRVVDGKGYVFRDEVALLSEYGGAADYFKTDGSKVSVGEALAKVSNGNRDAKDLVSYYDQKIAILKESVNSGYRLGDLPSVNEEISDSYYSLAKMLATGDTGGIPEAADKLLMYMNSHSLLTDERSPVDDTLERMEREREGILNSGSASKTEYASEGGYFYSYADGYEEYFTLAAADGITHDGLRRLTEGDVRPDEAVRMLSYGKLADSNEWRFVVKMGAVSAAYFKEGEVYRLQFAENGNKVIPMTLGRVVSGDGGEGKILVFCADRLPDGFVFDRCQSVSVEVSTESGIYVPRSAIHRRGGEYCVYVLKGSVVRMRWIEPVYEGTDYFLSKTDMTSDTGVPYLGTNELLITSGNNLFDGRILD